MEKQKQEKQEKPLSPEEKREMKSFFILAFPFVIVAIIAVGATKDVMWAGMAIVCAIYGLIMLKQFVDDYYRNR